jgi:CheY-like chemotaxis protein
MSKQSKILFVEDSGFLRKAVAQSLTNEGFDAITAATGEEALKFAQSEQPGLILLDMMLPRLDGMMVLRVLRASVDTRHIPVIVLSGNSMDRDKTAAQNLGVSHYFRKDSSPMEELVASIRSTIGVSA